MLQLDWEKDGLIEKVGAALGQDDRQVKDDLARFKALIERDGEASGAWRGEVDRLLDGQHGTLFIDGTEDM